MKKTKYYNINCPSCQGTGVVSQPDGNSSSSQRTCPACGGSGVVMVTEISED